MQQITFNQSSQTRSELMCRWYCSRRNIYLFYNRTHRRTQHDDEWGEYNMWLPVMWIARNTAIIFYICLYEKLTSCMHAFRCIRLFSTLRVLWNAKMITVCAHKVIIAILWYLSGAIVVVSITTNSTASFVKKNGKNSENTKTDASSHKCQHHRTWVFFVILLIAFGIFWHAYMQCDVLQSRWLVSARCHLKLTISPPPHRHSNAKRADTAQTNKDMIYWWSICAIAILKFRHCTRTS